MEEYPEELRTPPVGLISLVGCPELHAPITKFLHSQQPPLNTLAFPDFSKISLLLSASTTSKDPLSHSSTAAAGILKRDWLLKHRTKIPALVAALFPSHHVSGDPTQWLQVCSDIDDLKAVIRPKNIKLVVVVIHSSSNDEISEDRIIAIRKRAELDSKYLLFFNPDVDSELQLSLKRLRTTFEELANAYYRDEGKRIKTRIEKKSFNSIELNVRYCFKVAVYAEFRREWAEALKFYEDGYHILREMVGTSTRLPAVQRLVEIRTVAEQLHLKISTLLLHGGKVIEAITWFHQHNASYRKLVGAPEVIFLHWEWMSKQFLVFAELLETSSAAVQSTPTLVLSTAGGPLTECEFYPAYYYQSAAHFLKEKRSAFEIALSMSETAYEINSSVESVVPSIYVGQFARLLEQVDGFAVQPLTDDEYTRYTIAEGKRSQDSFKIIALLKKSYESYGNLKVRRMGSLCGFQIGREYFAIDDFSNAKQFFDGVANLYRQEGWVSLMWDVLGYLRECSRKLGTVKYFIEYSLEMAALPVSSSTGIQSFSFKECGPGGPASLSGRESIHKEVFGLVYGKNGLASQEEESNFKLTGDNPLHLEIDLVSPLRSVLLASVAFHEQIIRPGSSSLITVSLLSQLPLAFEINQLEIQFNQSQCNFFIINDQRPPLDATSGDRQGCRIEPAASLAVVTNKWLRLTYEITSEQSGKLDCLSVIAKIGPHFTICCRAESPASMDDLPLWKYEDRVETLPTKDPALAFSGQKAIQVEEPEPQVDLALGASGPAFVGEDFMMPVTVTSKEHAVYSGELKINLVDVRGGGLFSPREAEPFSMDSHHVELVGIAGPEGEDESELGTDRIKKIQQSFGLVSVPFLAKGESWSCKLEIKWHRPKPVMLFVSLGYSPDISEVNPQKIHVHKSLQIDGKTAVIISHRFMLPFRRDPLLLSKIRPDPNSDQIPSLPLNDASVLVISARNCSEIPLKLLFMCIEVDDNDKEKSCLVRHGGEDLTGSVLVPGEELKKIFTLIPKMGSSRLTLGSVHLKWQRYSVTEDQSSSTMSEDWISTKHKLPDVNVEVSPLVVSLDCPPYAILGDAITFSIKVQNQTRLLQEVKFTLADAQCFVLSGSHSDTVSVLPKSEHIQSFKLVPLASGLQQLPKVTVTTVRYSAEFQPCAAASTVFIFPTIPYFRMADTEDEKKEFVKAD